MKKTTKKSTKNKPAKMTAEEVDVDTRFLLANERTLLAWMRTALALIAGGLALGHFSDNSAFSVGLGILVMLLGACMALFGYARFKSADKAIRTGSLPPSTNWAFIQVGTVVLFAILLAFVQLSLL